MTKLKPSQDAYGQAMLDFYLGKFCTGLMIERDDGYIDNEFPIAGYMGGYKSWSKLDRSAIKCVQGRVLDIGCGAGRHAVHLQQLGMKVTGVDVSPGAIRTSRLRGLKDARAASITDLNRKTGIFDTIVMLGNNFGLFGSPSKARRLLRRFTGMTSVNGRIIAKCIDPYATSFPEHLSYHRLNRSRGRMSGQLRIRVRYKNYASPWFDYLFASLKEMEEIIQGSGWRISHVFSDTGPAFIALILKD